MKKKQIAFILAVLIILNLSPTTAIFSEEIRVVTEAWEPYNFEKDGKIIGIATEIVKYSLKEAGINISGNKIELYPWARSYKIALHNDNVLIYTILRTQKREKLFKWIGPIITSDKFNLYKKRTQKNIKVSSLEDVKKYQIGILRGSVHEDFLKNKGFSKDSIQKVSNQELNLIKLLKGRIDFIIDTDASLKIRTKQMNLPLSEFERSLFLFNKGYYMAINKNISDNIVEKVRYAFSKMKNEGKIDKIIKKYNQL